MNFDLVVVGAGLAGLSCASRLAASGASIRVVEASSNVGGRVRTYRVDGFQVDRGFQVYLTAYPEGRAILDYEQLALQPFAPGAFVRLNGKFHRLSDPSRDLRHCWETITSPLLTLADKIKVFRWQNEAKRREIDQPSQSTASTTKEMLRQRGFSQKAIDRFFRPFLGGAMLDGDLDAPASHGDFLFRMFSQGAATIPRGGMGAIPEAIAARLPRDCVRLECPVRAVESGWVTLESGERIASKAIVIATDAMNAAKLADAEPVTKFRGVTTLNYACQSAPVSEPILLLNGEGPEAGPVNDLCVISNVAPTYAPTGQSLVSATVLGFHEDIERVTRLALSQLRTWFGDEVDDWRLLRTYQIKHALPESPAPQLADGRPSQWPRKEGVSYCGDWLQGPSINDAIASGREAADAVASYLHSHSITNCGDLNRC